MLIKNISYFHKAPIKYLFSDQLMIILLLCYYDRFQILLIVTKYLLCTNSLMRSILKTAKTRHRTVKKVLSKPDLGFCRKHATPCTDWILEGKDWFLVCLVAGVRGEEGGGKKVDCLDCLEALRLDGGHARLS